MMSRIITIFLAIGTLCGNVMSQTHQPFLIQFDKPLYAAGETVWFALFRTDSGFYQKAQEVVHFELISPQNIKVIQGKVPLNERLAHGYFMLPTSLDEGYYRFRAYTLQSLRDSGYYLSSDIPVYSEWKENLTVYKYEDPGADAVDNGAKAQLDKKKKFFARRDTAEYSDLISNPGSLQYAFWVLPKEFEKFTPIQFQSKKTLNTIEINSDIEKEDSLYFEAYLSETKTEKGVTSPLISIYSGQNKRFYRSRATDGKFSLKLPYYEGETTLQVFNLNPYQEAVNDLRVSQWSISEGYFNLTKPPMTKEIAEYLINAKRRRKVYDLFSLSQSHAPVLSPDSSLVVPDKVYKMSDYRYINTLEDFIFEAIPNARVKTQEDGSKTVRLFDTERGKMFMDRPWYIVDGYLTNREEEVLKIPFNDIDEIRLYVRTNTIKKYFEYFLWRNGILEVITRDIKYLRSLKSDPNYVDFAGFIPEMNFLESLNGTDDPHIPDFRTTLFWETGKKREGESLDISFPLSDDTGRFVYHLLAVSGTGEVIRRKGEFEVR